jgi:hypothetical protein
MPGSINAKVPKSALHVGQVKEALNEGWLVREAVPSVKGKVKKVVANKKK